MAIGLHLSIKIQRTADSRTRINKAGCCKVNVLERELGVKRALGGVRRIERACLPFERHFAASGQGRGERERHCAMRGNVMRHQVYILVSDFLARRMAAAMAHTHSSVSDLKLIDRYIWRR